MKFFISQHLTKSFLWGILALVAYGGLIGRFTLKLQMGILLLLIIFKILFQRILLQIKHHLNNFK